MDDVPEAGRAVSRRFFIGLAPLVALAQDSRAGQVLPGALARYLDGATEFEIIRLTPPEAACRLPALPAKGVSRRSDAALIVSSPVSGRTEAQWVEFKDGSRRVLVDSSELQDAKLSMSPDDRWLVFNGGEKLYAVQNGNLRQYELAGRVSGAEMPGAPVVGSDNLNVYWVEESKGRSVARTARLPRGPVRDLAEIDGRILDVTPNPKRSLIGWRTAEGELWISPIDGGRPRRMETAEGRVIQFHWAPDGQSLLYLLEPAQPGRLVEIRERGVDTRSDDLVAKTSQFACFAPNSNASVFVGASRSKASPYILVVLRAAKRELTLCEHRSSDAQLCRPVFSPDSQKVLFNSDLHGASAVYMTDVAKFIEKTTE